MPDYKVEFYQPAINEIESARDWYANRNITVSVAFVGELSHAVKQISENPMRWPKFHNGSRRYIFPRYPFSLVYRIKKDLIEVIAVMHHRRKPGYWNK